MEQQLSIAYNEIDFLIPSYRFNIRFSYVTKRGLPFVREFVLRLVHLSPMRANEIAEYLGFTEREAKEALRDLIERDELAYNALGKVKLTSKANEYFSELGASPQVSAVLTTGTVLGFEATAFNCVSSNDKRLNDKWNYGLRVDVKSEMIASRIKLAQKAFQNQFYSFLDQGLLKHLKDNENTGRPSIYKIDSVKQIGQEPFRVKLNFTMDENGVAIGRDDIDNLENSSSAQELITAAIHKQLGSNNLKETIIAIEKIGDSYTGSMISDQGINISTFIQHSHSKHADSGEFIPFIGSLSSENNWHLFSEHFQLVKDKLIKNHQDKIKQLIWLVPSQGLWGRNNRLKNCVDSIFNGNKTKGKNTKTIYKPNIYVPVSSYNDRQSKNRWKDELSNHLNNVNAYIEGFLSGAVEIILLESELVSVTYYLTLPDIYPVPIPIGFISKNKLLVDGIKTEMDEYLTGLHDMNNRRDLGGILKL